MFARCPRSRTTTDLAASACGTVLDIPSLLSKPPKQRLDRQHGRLNHRAVDLALPQAPLSRPQAHRMRLWFASSAASSSLCSSSRRAVIFASSVHSDDSIAVSFRLAESFKFWNDYRRNLSITE